MLPQIDSRNFLYPIDGYAGVAGVRQRDRHHNEPIIQVLRGFDLPRQLTYPTSGAKRVAISPF